MKFESRRSTVMARNGMVATSQPLASMAGLRMMLQGGNAVDAAVATAAALAVVEPASTGMGGDVFALVWMEKEKQVRALNASGCSPKAASAEELLQRGLTMIPAESPFAVTVPGAVSGWEALLTTNGTMPMSEVLKPAITYASEGYPVSPIISSHWVVSEPKLAAHPSGNELLLDGRAPRPGEVMRLPELARTLQTIADGGASAFYRGPLAERTARFVQELGGWLTTDDLAGYQADWVEPMFTDYRGVRCWQCPPNSQGINTLMALNLAEGFDLPAMGFQSADAFHHLVECVRIALADGLDHVTDPDSMKVSAQRLLSKTWADHRRSLISPEKTMVSVPPAHGQVDSDTVYITCVDGDGNACSLINSVYMGFGTGLVVPGTGVALHNRGASFSLNTEHVNALEPGKRPYHTLMPGMATREGELWLSYGVMGAMQQAQGHLQVLVDTIDFGLDPQSALDAPRFSVRFSEGVAIEETANPSVISDLAERGHRVLVGRPHGIFFGGGQVIERDPESGVLKGGSEPRLDGCAVGW